MCFEKEKKRKKTELLVLYKLENNSCKLCKYWQENRDNCHHLCVEHWTKFTQHRNKEMKKWEEEFNKREE